MSTAIHDKPISFGLAIEALRNLRMIQVGEARRKVREMRADLTTDPMDLELAEQALEDARQAVARSQRITDAEAREILENEGVTLCKE